MQHLETCLPIEADRISCRHLLMFLTVFFQWMYKTKYSCYQDSSVIHDWFVYWVFGPEMRRLSNSSDIQFRMLSFSLFTLLDVKEGLKAHAVLASLEGFLRAASLPVSSRFMSR